MKGKGAAGGGIGGALKKWSKSGVGGQDQREKFNTDELEGLEVAWLLGEDESRKPGA